MRASISDKTVVLKILLMRKDIARSLSEETRFAPPILQLKQHNSYLYVLSKR